MNKAMLSIFLAGGVLLTYIFLFEKEQPVALSEKSELRNEKGPTPQGATQTGSLQAKKTRPHESRSPEENPDQSVDTPAEDRADLEARYQAANTNSDYPTLEAKLREIYQRRPDSDYQESELVDALQKNSAWERLEEKPANLDLPEKQKFYDPEYIRFDRLKIETLSVGDTMEIPVVHTGETYVMQIEEVETHGNENITWRGTYSYQGENFHISFTQSTSGLTVGGMNTPNGHYTLEAHDEVGWVVSSNSGLQHSSKPDYIIPQYE